MFSREILAVMEAAADAVIVINHHGQIAALNDATRTMFGYRSDELLGENVSKLMPEPHRGAHDGYLADYHRTGNARIIGTSRKVTALRKDGSEFPAHLSVGRIAGSALPRFVGILRDVSREHDALVALKMERDRANAYLELNDAILLMLDTERRIVEINARGSDILGAPKTDLHGRDWLEFMRGEDERDRALSMLECSLVNGVTREREFDALSASNEKRRIYWRCIARRASDGAPAGWLCSGQDVTDRDRLAHEVLVTQDRLTRVARFATLGEMAAGVAHELNQPLTAITTYARACERYLDMGSRNDADLKEAVREIASEGHRAGEIIRRLRQLVRSDPVERRPTDVNAVLDELKALLQADARLHGVELRFERSTQLPQVLTDYNQIQQVILNLARNAFEALAANSPGDREVTITTRRTESGESEIQVADNGPGVSAEIAGKLFEAFATSKHNGTGLGLAMSRTLVESHKGTIGMRALDPRGTMFFVRLPASAQGEA